MTEDVAEVLFSTLYLDVEWEEGVRSRKGFTRLAKPINPMELGVQGTVGGLLAPHIHRAIASLGANTTYAIVGIYINLYENGEMWTPNHSHPGQHQIVISLGAKRPLLIGKTAYPLESGEAVIFGAGIHGVPKAPEVRTPRISVAVFLRPSP
jgi:hypothetical protein